MGVQKVDNVDVQVQSLISSSQLKAAKERTDADTAETESKRAARKVELEKQRIKQADVRRESLGPEADSSSRAFRQFLAGRAGAGVAAGAQQWADAGALQARLTELQKTQFREAMARQPEQTAQAGAGLARLASQPGFARACPTSQQAGVVQQALIDHPGIEPVAAELLESGFMQAPAADPRARDAFLRFGLQQGQRGNLAGMRRGTDLMSTLAVDARIPGAAQRDSAMMLSRVVARDPGQLAAAAESVDGFARHAGVQRMPSFARGTGVSVLAKADGHPGVRAGLETLATDRSFRVQSVKVQAAAFRAVGDVAPHNGVRVAGSFNDALALDGRQVPDKHAASLFAAIAARVEDVAAGTYVDVRQVRRDLLARFSPETPSLLESEGMDEQARRDARLQNIATVNRYLRRFDNAYAEALKSINAAKHYEDLTDLPDVKPPPALLTQQVRDEIGQAQRRSGREPTRLRQQAKAQTTRSGRGARAGEGAPQAGAPSGDTAEVRPRMRLRDRLALQRAAGEQASPAPEEVDAPRADRADTSADAAAAPAAEFGGEPTSTGARARLRERLQARRGAMRADAPSSAGDATGPSAAPATTPMPAPAPMPASPSREPLGLSAAAMAELSAEARAVVDAFAGGGAMLDVSMLDTEDQQRLAVRVQQEQAAYGELQATLKRQLRAKRGSRMPRHTKLTRRAMDRLRGEQPRYVTLGTTRGGRPSDAFASAGTAPSQQGLEATPQRAQRARGLGGAQQAGGFDLRVQITNALQGLAGPLTTDAVGRIAQQVAVSVAQEVTRLLGAALGGGARNSTSAPPPSDGEAASQSPTRGVAGTAALQQSGGRWHVSTTSSELGGPNVPIVQAKGAVRVSGAAPEPAFAAYSGRLLIKDPSVVRSSGQLFHLTWGKPAAGQDASAYLNKSETTLLMNLGFTRESWESKDGPRSRWPSVWLTPFAGLTAAQHEAARKLGFEPSTWDAGAERLLATVAFGVMNLLQRDFMRARGYGVPDEDEFTRVQGGKTGKNA